MSYLWKNLYINWIKKIGTVYSEDNANIAYGNFIQIFSKHYNENCPLQKILSMNIKKDKPWLTSGLKHACRKKKCLYIKCLRDRTLYNEQQYKT